MHVEVTPLPGIGTRQDFQTRSGRRIGIVSYRDGRYDLIVSKTDDPDACVASIPLSPEEISTLANLLGAPQLVNHLERQHAEVSGISTAQLPIAPGSPFDGRTLGDTELRTRTGVSVVAVMRAATAHPSPTPDFRFAGGDLLVVVGTPDGIGKAAERLDRG
ncbi:cation:proton antiporter regulatory subunit [Allokutzneria albata]|uniref:Potassium/proton antiporter regulatory subunit, CPA2 family n=1 Tax=Allokutzneria albata TaxID=211114 RepID=A0A1G9VV19_ALLAB|nr:cation:proton antiporter regulatory subunit [Allokutzneria albata]SDM75826.1 potassium/proton antiporter regulatory subunit, CPA2 family [Allokutzneria albata]